MSQVLAGKVAIVTGAGGGIGRCHALALAAAGARVVVNDLGTNLGGEGADRSRAQAVVDEIVGLGGEAVANGASVADWEAAGSLVAAAVTAFGRLDIVVNNAGVARFGPLHAVSKEDWDGVIAVNFTGSVAMNHFAGKYWAEVGPASGRAIVNTSSPAGTHPGPGAAAYCISKAAVLALTVTSAGELAHLGVRVNAVCPMARTRMSDFPHMVEINRKPETGFDRVAPENVSPLVVYLSSSLCGFTGRVFAAEGDDVFLFDGFSANHHVNNARRQWTAESLQAALADVDPVDHGLKVSPSQRVPGDQPSAATLGALAGVG